MNEGVWAADVWAPGVWGQGVWFENGVGPVVAAATDTSDLLPFDFLTQFSIQQRQWLQARKKWEVEHAVREIIRELPPAAVERLDLPTKRAVEVVDGVSTIVMRVDYAAVMKRAEALAALLDLLMDDEDDAVAILLMGV